MPTPLPKARIAAASRLTSRFGYGDLIRCAIGQVGDQDVFRFRGGSGETVRLQSSRLSGDGNACFQLYDPNGLALSILTCSNGSRDYLLQQTGSHTVVLTDYLNDQTVSYSLSLDRIDPPSPAAKPIDYNQLLNDDVDGQGDMDLFYFSGEAGDTVRLQSSRLNGAGNACFQLYAPDGARLSILTCSNGARDYLLDQSGPHTVVVTDYLNDQTVSYSLSAVCISGFCPGLEVPDVAGCVSLKGAPLVDRGIRLIQDGYTAQTTRTDVRGCYAFESIIEGEKFRVKIHGPLVE